MDGILTIVILDALIFLLYFEDYPALFLGVKTPPPSI
jgi:hypothetical protein